MDWSVPRGVIALVGAGDSCKSTILDALELALSPAWNPRLSDNDFFLADPATPVMIEVTVGDIQAELKADRKFGLDLRGFTVEGQIRDEPADGDEHVLTVRFILEENREPQWGVVNDRLPEPKPISARDRQLLGMTRLGGTPDHHFSWGRGSALAEAESNMDDVSALLSEIERLMRASAAEVPLELLDRSVARATLAAIQMGAGSVAEELRAALNADAIAARGSGLALHTGEVPLSRLGLGTRRLTALGLQRLSTPSGAIMLIDEVESGLEPFRVRHLLRQLRSFLAAGDGEKSKGQVLLTTHSPIALQELNASEIHIVRRDPAGHVSVEAVKPSLQAMVRTHSEAFLARRIVVGEGKTELGLITAVDAAWSRARDGRSIAHVGAVPVLGEGSSTGRQALDFHGLGFPVAVLADSDQPLDPPAAALEERGIAVFCWADDFAVEDRLFADLPWEGVEELYELAVDSHGRSKVSDAVRAQIDPPVTGGETLSDWVTMGVAEGSLRRALALAAKQKTAPWFKRIAFGQAVGMVVAAHWDALDGTDLRRTLAELGRWLHGDDHS